MREKSDQFMFFFKNARKLKKRLRDERKEWSVYVHFQGNARKLKKQLRYSSFSWTIRSNRIVQKIIMIYNGAFNTMLFF